MSCKAPQCPPSSSLACTSKRHSSAFARCSMLRQSLPTLAGRPSPSHRYRLPAIIRSNLSAVTLDPCPRVCLSILCFISIPSAFRQESHCSQQSGPVMLRNAPQCPNLPPPQCLALLNVPHLSPSYDRRRTHVTPETTHTKPYTRTPELHFVALFSGSTLGKSLVTGFSRGLDTDASRTLVSNTVALPVRG
ncbi:hypothetical protein EDB80DRAFT_783103 [Ilyonectria destructans]|nr:hypothetical protein EDB80DRAFT_783103 [Ilyonectria destructans]